MGFNLGFKGLIKEYVSPEEEGLLPKSSISDQK